MSARKLNIKKISNDGFNIAIIKTTMYNLVVDVLSQSKVAINKEMIIGIINEIPIEEYALFEQNRKNELEFNKLLKNKTEVVITLYVKRMNK